MLVASRGALHAYGQRPGCSQRWPVHEVGQARPACHWRSVPRDLGLAAGNHHLWHIRPQICSHDAQYAHSGTYEFN